MEVEEETVKEDSPEEKNKQTMTDISVEIVKEDSEEERQSRAETENKDQPPGGVADETRTEDTDSQDNKNIELIKVDESLSEEKLLGKDDVTTSVQKSGIDYKKPEIVQDRPIYSEKFKMDIILGEESDSSKSSSPEDDKYMPVWSMVPKTTVFQNTEKERELYKQDLEDKGEKISETVYMPPTKTSPEDMKGTVYQNWPVPPPVPARKPKEGSKDSPPLLPEKSFRKSIDTSNQGKNSNQKPPPVPEKSMRASIIAKTYQNDEKKQQSVEVVTEKVSESESGTPKAEKMEDQSVTGKRNSVKALAAMFETRPDDQTTSQASSNRNSQVENNSQIQTNVPRDISHIQPSIQCETDSSDSDEFHSSEEGNANEETQKKLEKETSPEQDIHKSSFKNLTSVSDDGVYPSYERSSDVVSSLHITIAGQKDLTEEEPPPVPLYPPPSQDNTTDVSVGEHIDDMFEQSEGEQQPDTYSIPASTAPQQTPTVNRHDGQQNVVVETEQQKTEYVQTRQSDQLLETSPIETSHHIIGTGSEQSEHKFPGLREDEPGYQQTVASHRYGGYSLSDEMRFPSCTIPPQQPQCKIPPEQPYPNLQEGTSYTQPESVGNYGMPPYQGFGYGHQAPQYQYQQPPYYQQNLFSPPHYQPQSYEGHYYDPRYQYQPSQQYQHAEHGRDQYQPSQQYQHAEHGPVTTEQPVKQDTKSTEQPSRKEHHAKLPKKRKSKPGEKQKPSKLTADRPPEHDKSPRVHRKPAAQKVERHIAEKFSVCVKGLVCPHTSEELGLYLESLSKYGSFEGVVDWSNIVYGEDKTIAVAIFSDKPDFQHMKQQRSKKKFKGRIIEICEAGPVKGVVVSSEQEIPSNSALRQYFQTDPNSGGGRVKDISPTEDGCVKVYFNDHANIEGKSRKRTGCHRSIVELLMVGAKIPLGSLVPVLDKFMEYAADSVCEKSHHSIDGADLCVTKLFECEFGDIFNQQEHKVCLPNELKVPDIDHHKKMLITKSTTVVRKLNEILDPVFAKVKISEDLYIECTLEQTTQNVRQLAKKWETEVRKIWLAFVEETTHKVEMIVAQDVWPHLLPHVNEQKSRDSLHIDITQHENSTKLIFVGHKDIFETVTTTISEHRDRIVAEVERKKRIAEDKMTQSKLDVCLLLRTEILDELNTIADDLNVSADREKGEIYFVGVPEDIQNAKCKIYEIFNKFGKLKLHPESSNINKDEIDLLRNPDIFDNYVKSEFEKRSLTVEVEFEDEAILVRCLPDSQKSEVQNIICCAVKRSERIFKTIENQEVLKTPEFRKEIRNVKAKYDNMAIINPEPSNFQITVTSTADVHGEILQRLDDFIHTSAVYTETLEVKDEGKMKFVEQKCCKMLQSVEEDLEKYHVVIEVESMSFKLKGTKEGLKKVKAEISKCLNDIISKQHTITRLGIDTVIHAGTEEFFVSVERNTNCVVMLRDTGNQTENFLATIDSDSEDEYSMTEVGETWRTSGQTATIQEEEDLAVNVASVATPPPPVSTIPVKNMMKCKNGTTIKLEKGELGKQKADILVCTTSKEFELSKGKCGANLLHYGGTMLQDLCQAKYPDGVSPGDVAVIGPAQLTCKQVYLGTLPVWNQDPHKGKTMKLFMKNSLLEAEKGGYSSICFASLGTGGLKYPPNTAAHLMYQAVIDYDQKHRNSCVKDVRFVLYRKDTAVISAFEDEEYSQKNPSSRFSFPKNYTGPFDTKQGIKVTFVEGPIDQQQVDVIVTASQKDLNLAGGGVGKALLATGGNSLAAECKAKYPGGIGYGDVVEINGGNLHCKKVYITSLPDYNSEEEKAKIAKKDKTLYKAVYQFLEKAVKSGMTSIALPAMGTKIKWPANFVACLMYDCVVDFASKNPNSCLVDVRFVVIPQDTPTVQAFKNEEQHRLSPTQNYSSGLKSFYTKKPSSGVGTSTGIQVSIETGSMEKFSKADVITCSVAGNLNLSQGQVGQALLQEGGTSLQQECNTKYPSGIKVGDVAKIGPGNLSCKGVYLVTLPQYTRGKEKECDKLLLELINKVLEAAGKDGMTSVAFPSLGTGYNRFPYDRVATLSYEAVSQYSHSNPNSAIKTVYFVVFPKNVASVQAFKREEQKRTWSPSSVVAPPQPAATPLRRAATVKPDLSGTNVGIGAKFKRTFMYKEDDKPRTPKRSNTTFAQSTRGGKPNEFLFGPISLTIGQGSLVELKKPVDAIVNGADEYLDFNKGGVSKAILNSCDRKMLDDECKAKKAEMKKNGITYTSACGLRNCTAIIHVTAQDSLKGWQKMIVKCLELADSLQYTSIAFPALGTGTGFTVFKCEEISETMHDSLIEFTTKHSKPNLRNIRLTVFEQRMVWPMTEKMTKCCETSSTPDYKKKMQGFGLAPRRGIVSKSSLPTVTMWVLSNSENEIQRGIQRITELVESRYTEYENDDPIIESLEVEEINKLENLKKKYAVELSVDQSKHLIVVKGTKEEVDAVKGQIYKYISDFSFKRHEASEAEFVATQVQWYCKETNSKGLLELAPYPKLINMKLENTLKGNHPFLDFYANDVECRVDMATMKEFEKANKANSTDVIRREKQEDGKHALPTEWTEMTDPSEIVKVVPLLPTTKEYTDLETKFTTSVKTGKFKDRFVLPNLKVLGIERIQNPSLYRQYACKRELIEKNNPNPQKTPNEQLLWHGTKQDVLVSINYYGFNRSYAGVNGTWFGHGVYFANDASYSARDWVAPKAAQGKQAIYLTRVLTGQYCKGHKDMRYLPPLPGNNKINYDSAVEDLNNPLEFVIFNDTQAYPEYCIYFSF